MRLCTGGREGNRGWRQRDWDNYRNRGDTEQTFIKRANDKTWACRDVKGGEEQRWRRRERTRRKKERKKERASDGEEKG